MKATVLYCDRCAGEGKGEVRASLVVWIRSSLGGRTVRLDVCADYYAVIVGQTSPNGAAPDKREWLKRGGGVVKEQQAYERLIALSAKRSRFSLEEAQASLEKTLHRSGVAKVLAMLIQDGKLERHMPSIYQRPGYSIPAPATVELAVAAVLKLVKAHPGMRCVSAAALAGIENVGLWRKTLEHLRTHKLARTKGTKAAMRVYPL